MTNDVKCPYCDEYNEICHDDGYGYEEERLHQQECSECEKTFTFTTFIYFSYEAYKADCLNGGEHEFEKTITYPPEFAKLRCIHCDEVKTIK